MKQTAYAVDNAILAWDNYCSGQYTEIIENYRNDSPELQDLKVLAELELGESEGISSDQSVFSSLTTGMLAFYNHDYSTASDLLGNWLLHKNYFAPIILQRFLKAAKTSGKDRLTYTVCRKFFEWKNYIEFIVEPFFEGAFALQKYEEAIYVFEKYKRLFRNQNLLQKAAFAFMHVGRWKEAERLFLILYEKISGKGYRSNYEGVRAEYLPVINKIPELEKRRNRSENETWQLGMAYLFNQQFNEAMRIFESMLNEAAA